MDTTAAVEVWAAARALVPAQGSLRSPRLVSAGPYWCSILNVSMYCLMLLLDRCSRRPRMRRRKSLSCQALSCGGNPLASAQPAQLPEVAELADHRGRVRR